VVAASIHAVATIVPNSQTPFKLASIAPRPALRQNSARYTSLTDGEQQSGRDVRVTR
jgi:hypothetical protein